jgi:hypothetical protein
MTSTRKNGPSDRRQAGRDSSQPPRDLKGGAPSGPKPEAVVCRSCGAVLRERRWQRLSLPETAEVRRTRCPACMRVRNDDPAGVVTLVGSFVRLHAEEIARLIRHEEASQRRSDCQSRIIRIRRMLDRIDVTTTDTRLPRRIGEAAAAAYGGMLHVMEEADGSAIRVRWLIDERRPAAARVVGQQAGRRAAGMAVPAQRITTVRWPKEALLARWPAVR